MSAGPPESLLSWPAKRGAGSPLGPLVAALALATGCYSGEGPAHESEGGTAAGTSDGTSGGGSTGPSGGDAPLVPAFTPMHRLNRLEYNNTVRDLLGTRLRPADAFGPDPEANGFDNMADQLRVSASLLDAYDQAARVVIDDALDAQPAFRAAFAGDDLSVPGGYRVGELWGLNGQVVRVEVDVPAYMQGEIVVLTGALVGGNAQAPVAHLRVNGVDLADFAVQGTPAIPFAQVQPIALTAGHHVIEVVPTNSYNMPADNDFNNVFVAGVEARSTEMAPGPGHALVFVCEPAGDGDLACYTEILRNFAARAWRRPVTAAEEAALVAQLSDVIAQGEPADAALRLVMRGVMLSPKFFYRLRTVDDADADPWLDDYVLASRLSYFLWSSMPDPRLFDMAAEGRLATDEGLSEAVAFMLADPRAEALVDGFAEQWLALRHLDAFHPDAGVYPGFDDVRGAIADESRLFFADFLANDLPVQGLILPDFSYRSDLLAAHYGEPPVGSPTMVRVAAEGDARRGLLALGGWLSATSGADHSSPIRRGRWVSERLLCNPVPPPPAGLMFEPPDLGGADSVREALEKHRADPTCAGCHALLDVLGIGFEEYDGVARRVADPNVDNLGALPDGRTFNGAAGLAALYAESDVFVECFTRTLFTYGAGRPPSYDDLLALRELALAAREAQSTLPELIDAIVHTPSFRSPAPLDPAE